MRPPRIGTNHYSLHRLPPSAGGSSTAPVLDKRCTLTSFVHSVFSAPEMRHSTFRDLSKLSNNQNSRQWHCQWGGGKKKRRAGRQTTPGPVTRPSTFVSHTISLIGSHTNKHIVGGLCIKWPHLEDVTSNQTTHPHPPSPLRPDFNKMIKKRVSRTRKYIHTYLHVWEGRKKTNVIKF